MKANQLKVVFKILSVSLIFISFLACNQSDKYKENISVANVEVNEDFESINDDEYSFVLKQDASTNAIPKHLKIIKSANAKYKVKNVKKATNQIKHMAHKYGAYISDLRFENNLYKKENRFTIKIPEQHFDSMHLCHQSSFA